ncbi:hypothetical protein L7F22_037478 [Adiantum nelumboides]|nr:hypothetical protein [Adiantum nelumboides]
MAWVYLRLRKEIVEGAKRDSLCLKACFQEAGIGGHVGDSRWEVSLLAEAGALKDFALEIQAFGREEADQARVVDEVLLGDFAVVFGEIAGEVNEEDRAKASGAGSEEAGGDCRNSEEKHVGEGELVTEVVEEEGGIVFACGGEGEAGEREEEEMEGLLGDEGVVAKLGNLLEVMGSHARPADEDGCEVEAGRQAGSNEKREAVGGYVRA